MRTGWIWRRMGVSRRIRTRTRAGGRSMTTREANLEAIIAGFGGGMRIRIATFNAENLFTRPSVMRCIPPRHLYG